MGNDINLGSPQDFYFNLLTGDFSSELGYTTFEKFGRNDAVGTTPVSISVDGVYQVPTSATTLEAISTSANDTSAGTGARVITVTGLDDNCNEISEDITMNGTSATSITSNSFIRVYKVRVKDSGTYATAAAGSHAGDITIRASTGGVTYAKIDSSTFPRSASQIGAYTVPNGKKVFIKNITIATSVATNIMIFKREGANDTVAPFSPMVLIQEFDDVNGVIDLYTDSPLGPFDAMTDFGFMAYTGSGTSKVSVDFDIIQSV